MRQRQRTRDHELDLDQAVQRLQTGSLVAYPTETFFALGADAMNPEAINKLREIKSRGNKPISVIIANNDMLGQVAKSVSAEADNLMRAFWPGPLTLIVAAQDSVPEELRAGGTTIGVRVSSHIVARALSSALGGPITSTSCNDASEPEPLRREQIDQGLLEQIAGAVEGLAPGGLPSSIVDVSREVPRLLRHGAISLERLREVVSDIEDASED